MSNKSLGGNMLQHVCKAESYVGRATAIQLCLCNILQLVFGFAHLDM